MKDKKAHYLGWLVRLYCPSLYGCPVYDRNGRFIPYKISVPKVKEITVEDLIGDTKNEN